MQNAEDFRFTAHQLLLALDASTINMMKMVMASSMGNAAWKKAVTMQEASFTALHMHLAHPNAAALMQQGFGR
ncbi:MULTISPECIES: hypothetical protein [unclassified Pseudomonas]|uniref:hypothetical protein n=1 Tax=unclassified Pseudomonas TaxID=196821 RepID=UPI0025E9CF45|nr:MULTISPECIES: hypothetical protein [unclassified Pseudomonas]